MHFPIVSLDHLSAPGSLKMCSCVFARVKRGRGAIGSRMDEPGPYLTTPPSGRRDNSSSLDVPVEEWKRRVHGPEKPLFFRSKSSDEFQSTSKHQRGEKRKNDSNREREEKEKSRSKHHHHQHKKRREWFWWINRTMYTGKCYGLTRLICVLLLLTWLKLLYQNMTPWDKLGGHCLVQVLASHLHCFFQYSFAVLKYSVVSNKTRAKHVFHCTRLEMAS